MLTLHGTRVDGAGPDTLSGAIDSSDTSFASGRGSDNDDDDSINARSESESQRLRRREFQGWAPAPARFPSAPFRARVASVGIWGVERCGASADIPRAQRLSLGPHQLEPGPLKCHRSGPVNARTDSNVHAHRSALHPAGAA